MKNYNAISRAEKESRSLMKSILISAKKIYFKT